MKIKKPIQDDMYFLLREELNVKEVVYDPLIKEDIWLEIENIPSELYEEYEKRIEHRTLMVERKNLGMQQL